MSQSFLIEDSGFTVEEYFRLKDEGKSDRYIYENILFVSLQAFRDWKIRHNVIGKRLPRLYMNDQERLRINNELRSQGFKNKEIYNKLKLSYDYYTNWKMKMRRKGFEVL
ncbi:hypothetical protein [Metabacillus sp. Hm71]|uniref:hypothetical protein n=1 Tax=Metabacillus sp. Hm71 TaxID=3450743 RepID=UPI003F428943